MVTAVTARWLRSNTMAVAIAFSGALVERASDAVYGLVACAHSPLDRSPHRGIAVMNEQLVESLDMFEGEL
jgi:hypothetical protein